jgi:hypothetical protein
LVSPFGTGAANNRVDLSQPRAAGTSDLPIQEASKFEVIINAKTAKAFGLTVPPDSSAAPKVIE